MGNRVKRKIFNCLLVTLSLLLLITLVPTSNKLGNVHADTNEYYTIYDKNDSSKVLFMKGDNVNVDDEYISSDNRLYIIESVDESNKTGVASFKEDIKMPVYNVKRNEELSSASASVTNKKIGLYHTHNDECYNVDDGTDSIYGKGGIHDVGKTLKNNLESLGITVYYNEDLHLPHDSGAYTRSQSTASNLLRNGLDAIFDVHRDATPKSEYITTVNGEKMSKVRMVIGSANVRSAINKEFALNIKAYADEVYPGLIKDIYIGRGNYNQQLSERALLFEMGTNLIEKDLVKKSTLPLAKTIDVVLYGTKSASSKSVADVDTNNSSGDVLDTGMVGNNSTSSATNSTLWIILGSIGGVALIFGLVCIFSKKTRYAVGRFFSELFAGIFGKKKSERN